MFCAVNAKGEEFHLFRKENQRPIEFFRKERWFCPDCNTELVYRHGNRKVPHFSHKTLENCSYSHESESILHLNGKVDLYTACSTHTSAYLEYKLTNLSQRADIYLPNNDLAIEYQCSSLPFIAYKSRTEGYEKLNLSSWWIIGGTPRILTFHPYTIVNLRSFEQMMISFHPNLHWHLYYYNPSQKRLYLLHHLQVISPTKFVATVHYYPLSAIHPNLFFIPPLIKSQKINLQNWLMNRDRWLINKMTYTKNRKDPLLSSLYCHKVSPSYVPSYIGLPNSYQSLLLCHPFEWQWYVWAEGFLTNDAISIEGLVGILKRKINGNVLKHSLVETKDKQLYRLLVKEYVQVLLGTGVLTRLSENLFSIRPNYTIHSFLEKEEERTLFFSEISRTEIM